MGPIDITPVLWFYAIVGAVVALCLVGLGFGAWWLLQHVQWVS